ncbi:TRM11 family SAM-dependent methyltransferase [Streptomyces sp. NPDC102274]|uniref:TRM11 family SAM-dependent methyltransferase n=1 Tax=Streptomyces sp. NPDC102274 TaxID=3366151 RepID=UPI003820CBBC
MPSARPGAAESITHALTTGARPRVLVRTVTGLEHLAAAPLAAAGHHVIDMSKRQLIVEPTSASIVTDPPRLADDLFLIGATLADPGRTKADLTALARAARHRLTVPLRHHPGEGFAVSASFLGRRTYSRFDIEDVIGTVIAERTGATYHSRRGAPPPQPRLDWRVVLDGTTAHIALRPFDAPLHRRDWRHSTVTGSLHPPVAAAIARLARVEPGHRVLDPFCGSGTILLETAQIEPDAVYTGIDRDPGAIAAARTNTPGGALVEWRVDDGAHLDLLRTPVDRIVTNPPWGVRLDIGDIAVHLDRWRRVLRRDGLAVAIVNHRQANALIEDPWWRTIDVREVSVAGRHPRIVVAQPVTRRHNP